MSNTIYARPKQTQIPRPDIRHPTSPNLPHHLILPTKRSRPSHGLLQAKPPAKVVHKDPFVNIFTTTICSRGEMRSHASKMRSYIPHEHQSVGAPRGGRAPREHYPNPIQDDGLPLRNCSSCDKMNHNITQFSFLRHFKNAHPDECGHHAYGCRHCKRRFTHWDMVRTHYYSSHHAKLKATFYENELRVAMFPKFEDEVDESLHVDTNTNDA
jgi:hypothetical protein